jgi:hypothetical protein
LKYSNEFGIISIDFTLGGVQMADRLADFWESIPLWLVAVVAVAVLVGLYLGMQALHVPSWGVWLTFGGLGAGALVAVIRRIGGGG